MRRRKKKKKKKKKERKRPMGLPHKRNKGVSAPTSAKPLAPMPRDLGACFTCLLSASPVSGSQFPQLAQVLDVMNSPQPWGPGAS